MKTLHVTFISLLAIALFGCLEVGAPNPTRVEPPILLPCGQKLHMYVEDEGGTYIIRPMREGEVAETYTAFYRSGINWEIRECLSVK